MKKLDVCICTHNPRRDIFQIVLEALSRQTLPKASYHVWVIDNASEPPLSDRELQPLIEAGVAHTLLYEPQLGTVHARLCAAKATQGELVLFVDDDNELTEDYLETALDITLKNPQIGCFGGKLLLAPEINVPQWTEPLLPYLAVHDKGDQVITNSTDYWGLWEPSAAGAIVRRAVLERYVEQMETIPTAAQIGCKGNKEILRSEDSLMMRGAYYLGLQCSYQPRLSLRHHVDPSRLTFSYLVKLLYGYGRSFIILERTLGNFLPTATFFEAVKTIIKKARDRRTKSLPHALCMIAWDVGYFYELQRGNTEVLCTEQKQRK